MTTTPVMRCFARLTFAAFFIVAYLTFVSLGVAQQTPAPPSSPTPGEVQADSGTRPNGTYDGLNDNVSLVNGNLSFCIPLISLPGPAMPPGMPSLDMNLPLCYNSEYITANGPSTQALRSWNPYNGTGLQFGWTLTGSAGMWAQTGTTTGGYPGGFLSDGSRFSTLTYVPPSPPMPWGPDTGGQGLYFQPSPGSEWPNGSLYLKNGIKYTSSMNAYSAETETDTLGHTITWGTNSITDAVGRTVNVNVNSTTGSFTFQYPNPSATSNSVSQDLTVTVQMGSVVSSSACPIPNFGGNGSAQVPTAVILPTGRQYTFLYDNCGLVRLVQYPSGGYTRYDYQQGILGAMTNFQVAGYVDNYTVAEIWHKYVCPVPASPGGDYSSSSCPVPEQVTTYTLGPTTSGPVGATFNNGEVTVTDPVGNYTQYWFSQPDPYPDFQTQAVETERQVYSAAGKLLRTVTTQYLLSYGLTVVNGCSGFNPNDEIGASLPASSEQYYIQDLPTLPTTQDTTLDNGMTSEIDWQYNCNPTWNGPTVLTDKKEYDYGSGGTHGALLKETRYDWLVLDANGDYYLNPEGAFQSNGKNILDRKTGETVYDGNGKMVEQTLYQYDNNTPATSGALGLLTQVQKWVSGTTYLTTNYQINGNAPCGITGYTATYPNGKIVAYNFSDNYVGEISPTNTLGCPYNAYPTTITTTANGNTYVEQKQYYWGGGEVAASCGLNYSGTCATGKSGVPDYATYTYDLMGRHTSTLTGDGGNTATCYSDDPGSSCASGPPFETVSTELVQSGVSKTTTTISMYAGSGSVPTTTTELNSDPSCAGGTVNVDTTYDLDGRKATVSNPYCSTNKSAATSGTTTYTYDGLSRVTNVTNPDGTSTQNTYTGRAVLSADEGNGGAFPVARITQTDALGRITTVCEISQTTQQGSSGNTPVGCGLDVTPPSPIPNNGFLTAYGYDGSPIGGPLESVTSVTQGGESRSFSYNGMGWLLAAQNPESGTTTYNSYDNDGNLLSKTNAKGITTTYTWDQLDRLTSKSYSDGTPSVGFAYDNSSILSGASLSNGLGRMTAEWTNSVVPTERVFGYDLMGRVAQDYQCVSTGGCATAPDFAEVVYGYDYAGDIASFTNGLTGNSALAFTNNYNSAGRLSTMTGPDDPNTGTGSFSLFSNPSYSPAGALAGGQIGTNITLARTYNNRLLPTGETDYAGNTPGTANISLTGNEQTFVQGIGSITFTGSEQSKTVNGTTTYDNGVIYVSLGGQEPFEVQYGQGSTPQSLAAAFANGLVPCGSGGSWNASASGATVNITSCTPLSSYTITIQAISCAFNSTGCSFSASTGGATASITISESSGTLTTGQIAMGITEVSGGAPVQDATVNWGTNDTPNSVAANLAAAFGSCSTSGHVVYATASGATVTLTSCQEGQEYNASQIGGNCSCGPGVAYFNAAVTGVVDGGDVYDSGTATLTVNNTQIATTTWGLGSTVSSIYQALASAASGNPLVNVSPNGTITAYDDGTDSTDYSYALTITDTSGLSGVTPSFRGTSGTLAGSTDAALYSWSIPASGGYAPNGNVLSMTDSVMGAWNYSYDDMNRLKGATAASGTDNGMTLNWTYDRYGNRWSQTATGTGGGSATQPQLSFTGNNNRIDSYSYDAAGNLLDDGLNIYAYDAEGRIKSINGAVGYVYDAEGNRVAKLNSSGTATSVYILNAANQQITELNGAGQWQHSNIYAPGGRLLATYDAPGQSSPGYHFNLTDWLGTKRMQTTSGGNQQETCLSNPFGDGLTCTGGTDATEQHFTGKDRDVESGLDYFYARYYSSMLGRFMTPDWAGKPTAVPYANFGDPQSLNLYAYVRNNPMTGIDMDGHVDPTGIPDPMLAASAAAAAGAANTAAAASENGSSGSNSSTDADGKPKTPTAPGDGKSSDPTTKPSNSPPDSNGSSSKTSAANASSAAPQPTAKDYALAAVLAAKIAVQYEKDVTANAFTRPTCKQLERAGEFDGAAAILTSGGGKYPNPVAISFGIASALELGTHALICNN